MRAVVQRCSWCRVYSEGEETGRIGQGLAVLLGVGKGDTEADSQYIAEKLLHLRIFEDAEGKMNQSVQDIDGEMMIISQFTLYGDCRHGRRPSFLKRKRLIRLMNSISWWWTSAGMASNRWRPGGSART